MHIKHRSSAQAASSLVDPTRAMVNQQQLLHEITEAGRLAPRKRNKNTPALAAKQSALYLLEILATTPTTPELVEHAALLVATMKGTVAGHNARDPGAILEGEGDYEARLKDACHIDSGHLPSFLRPLMYIATDVSQKLYPSRVSCFLHLSQRESCTSSRNCSPTRTLSSSFAS